MSQKSSEEILELGILVNLITSPEFFAKSFRYYKEEYFQYYKDTYIAIFEYVSEYSKCPHKKDCGLIFEPESDILKNLDSTPFDLELLLNKAEKFCKDSALFIAISNAVDIVQTGTSSDLEKNKIPEILEAALSINFNPVELHIYIKDAGKRWEFYHDVAEKIPFINSNLNQLTNGGIERGTLNVFLAPTGTGKTLILCDIASQFIKTEMKTLYITLEMSPEKIGNRIDANLLDTKINDVKELKKGKFIESLSKFNDNLIIIQFPMGELTVSGISNLLDDILTDYGFVPDIIFIDYLNLMGSIRVSLTQGSYLLVKSIAEEVRALAVKRNLVVFSATQSNRGGLTNAKAGNGLELEDTSASIGLPETCDLFVGVSRTKELDEEGKLFFSNIKNRYMEKSDLPSFKMGVDFSKSKLIESDNIDTEHLKNTSQFSLEHLQNDDNSSEDVLW